MNALHYYVTCVHIQVLIGQQTYLTSQIVLNSIFFDTQRPKRHTIEIVVENETEQMNMETAQQANRNLIQTETRGNQARTLVVPSRVRPTAKEPNVMARNSSRKRTQAEHIKGSTEMDISPVKASDPRENETDFKQDKFGGLGGMFQKLQKEPTPTFTSYMSDNEKPEEPTPEKEQSSENTKKRLSQAKQDKGGLMGGMFRKETKDKLSSPLLTENLSVHSELLASNNSLSDTNNIKEKGGIFSGMFKKSSKPVEEPPQAEEDQQSLHSELSASNDSLSDNNNPKAKGGLFSGILKKSPKAPREGTLAEALHGEYSDSNDSLSKNNSKEKGGIFSGMFIKSPKPAADASQPEDKRSLQGELSASNDSLADNSNPKETEGMFSGILRRKTKASADGTPAQENLSTRYELSASNDSLSENNKSREKKGLFSGILKKTPKASGDETPAQDNLATCSELSVSNNSLSDTNNTKEKGSLLSGMFKKSLIPADEGSQQEDERSKFSGMFQKSPKPADEGCQPEEDKRSLHSERSASNDSLSDNNNTKGKGIFSGMFKKATKTAGASQPEEDSDLGTDCNDNLSESKEKTGILGLTGIFKRSPRPSPRSTVDKDPLTEYKELSASNDSLSDIPTIKENLSAQKELSASNDSLSDTTTTSKEKKGGFAGIFRRTPKPIEQQDSMDTEPPVGGSQLRRRRTIKKKRRVVSFQVKRTLPRISKRTAARDSDKEPIIEEAVELQGLAPLQESTVEIQPVEMAAYPTDGVNLLESEEESDGLLDWWRSVEGWEQWNETSHFQEDEADMVVEQVADRVFMAARLFVRLFNQRGASLQGRILELLAQADAADQFHKRTVTAAVGGGVASVCGSVATITGLILAPFTFGASIIVTAVGISVATAGSIASATANITDTVHSNMDCKKVEKMIQGYQEEIKDIRECMEFVQEGMEALQEGNFEKYTESATKKALNHNIKHVMKEGGRAGKKLMINTDKLISTVQVLGVAGGAAKAVKAISVTTGVMSALFLALDVFFLAKDSHELRKGAKTKFASEIRQMCKDLQDGLLELNKVKTQLQKTMDGIELEEYEEEEEVEVEVDDDLESDPVKLAQLEQELDQLEEKLDKKVEEEQKWNKSKEEADKSEEREIKEEKNSKKKDSKKEEGKKARPKSKTIELGKLCETGKVEMEKEWTSERGDTSGRGKGDTSSVQNKKGSENGKKKDKGMESRNTNEKGNVESKKEKGNDRSSTNEEGEVKARETEKQKGRGNKNKPADTKKGISNENVESEKGKSERLKEQKVAGLETKMRVRETSERGNASRHSSKTDKEQIQKRSQRERGSRDEIPEIAPGRRRSKDLKCGSITETGDMERTSKTERDGVERGVRNLRAEMDRGSKDMYSVDLKGDSERGKTKEESEVKRTSGVERGTAKGNSKEEGVMERMSRRENKDRELRCKRERAEEKRGSKIEKMQRKFESGREGGIRNEDEEVHQSERDRKEGDVERNRRDGDAEQKPVRQGSRPRSKAICQFYI
ncbi:titin homolog isoform X3 [Salvelinus sp. IW2-2015]|uniref:titin homolog isoform X3 n=1 Tax=Salvelinus sp. IW2-2015 TaxID=2691554 RepID=UPI0038D4EF11